MLPAFVGHRIYGLVDRRSYQIVNKEARFGAICNYKKKFTHLYTAAVFLSIPQHYQHSQNIVVPRYRQLGSLPSSACDKQISIPCGTDPRKHCRVQEKGAHIDELCKKKKKIQVRQRVQNEQSTSGGAECARLRIKQSGFGPWPWTLCYVLKQDSHFVLTVSPSTQVYKWVLSKLMLGVTLR